PDKPSWSPDDPTTPAVDETDKFLLYEVPVPTGKHSSGMEIVRQQLATGTVTTVVPPSSGSWLGWTDWRRAPDAGWAPSSGFAATTTLNSATPTNTSSAMSLSLSPAAAL